MRQSRALRAIAATFIAAVSFSIPSIAAAGDAGQGRQRARPTPTADIRSRADRCGVRQPAAEQLELIEQAAANAIADAGGVITISVHWHIITTSSGGGNVSGLVADQMQVLNDAFAGSKFTFRVASTEVVANNTWFYAEAGSNDEVAMKAKLRRGGPDALNIYTTNGDVYLGWATLPFFYKFAPSYDGVVLWWAALPGTGLSGTSDDEPDGVLTYDQGDTGTHEVGHWLGLDHTFGPGDGCTHPGDKIGDTPVEAEPQFFCAPRDSCVGSTFKGDDPITNFMDYVDDVCMDNFTSEQTKRMRKHWHAFRDKKARQ